MTSPSFSSSCRLLVAAAVAKFAMDGAQLPPASAADISLIPPSPPAGAPPVAGGAVTGGEYHVRGLNSKTIPNSPPGETPAITGGEYHVRGPNAVTIPSEGANKASSPKSTSATLNDSLHVLREYPLTGLVVVNNKVINQVGADSVGLTITCLRTETGEESFLLHGAGGPDAGVVIKAVPSGGKHQLMVIPQENSHPSDVQAFAGETRKPSGKLVVEGRGSEPSSDAYQLIIDQLTSPGGWIMVGYADGQMFVDFRPIGVPVGFSASNMPQHPADLDPFYAQVQAARAQAGEIVSQ